MSAGQSVKYVIPLRKVVLGLGVVILTGVLPGLSIIEIATTGTIDLNAVGQGRRATPVWISYLIAWPIFIYIFYTMGLPLVRHLREGYIFIISEESIDTAGHSLPLSAITRVKRRPLFNDYILLAAGRKYRVTPNLDEGARLAFRDIFSDRME